jgi:hypothetical protein
MKIIKPLKSILYGYGYTKPQYKIMKQLIQTKSCKNFEFYLRCI